MLGPQTGVWGVRRFHRCAVVTSGVANPTIVVTGGLLNSGPASYQDTYTSTDGRRCPSLMGGRRTIECCFFFFSHRQLGSIGHSKLARTRLSWAANRRHQTLVVRWHHAPGTHSSQ